MSTKFALIIEDDENFSFGLADFFRSRGYTAETAMDGLAAVTLLEKTPTPDVILLDVHLPYQKGTEIFERIGQNPRFAHTRMAIMTADLEKARELEEQGVFVLVKPFFLAKLAAWLDGA